MPAKGTSLVQTVSTWNRPAFFPAPQTAIKSISTGSTGSVPRCRNPRQNWLQIVDEYPGYHGPTPGLGWCRWRTERGRNHARTPCCEKCALSPPHAADFLGLLAGKPASSAAPHPRIRPCLMALCALPLARRTSGIIFMRLIRQRDGKADNHRYPDVGQRPAGQFERLHGQIGHLQHDPDAHHIGPGDPKDSAAT